jgi:hypothetical protein
MSAPVKLTSVIRAYLRETLAGLAFPRGRLYVR